MKNMTNNGKRYSIQLAKAYVVYMMLGSYFKSSQCKNPCEAEHLYLHYQELPGQKQFREEEQVLRLAGGIHPEFRKRISELKCAVRFFRNKEDYCVYFFTGFEEVLATINPEGWCELRCLE